MSETTKPASQAKRQRRRARWFLKTNLARVRKALFPPREGDLVTSLDDKRIEVMRERFLYDRSGLLPILGTLKKRGTMVEVGSLAGFSTKIFARHFEVVYSVDPYAAGYDDRNDLNSERYRLHLARDLFSIRFVDEPNVIQYREPSKEASARFEDGTLDFVYLDGSHTFEDVCIDIECWRPKVASGGYIGGDDFTWDGVSGAVRRHFQDFEEISGRWLSRVE